MAIRCCRAVVSHVISIARELFRRATRANVPPSPALVRLMGMSRFIAPMLCERLTDLARVADGQFIAEAKLDGQAGESCRVECCGIRCF